MCDPSRDVGDAVPYRPVIRWYNKTGHTPRVRPVFCLTYSLGYFIETNPLRWTLDRYYV